MNTSNELMPSGFEKHIILYAKGWYDKDPNLTGNSYMEDLKKMLSCWAWVEEKYIRDRDIYEHVISVLVKFGEWKESPHEMKETLLEMIGQRWGQNKGGLSDRDPLTCAIGRLLTIDGKYCDTSEKLIDTSKKF